MSCLLCGSDSEGRRVNDRARGGALQLSVSCDRCGFVQVSPLPSAEALAEYYRSGRYREDFPLSSDARARSEIAGGAAALALRELGAHAGVVYEVGCGPGDVAALLRSEGLNVVGVDADPEMLRLAADRGVPVASEVSAGAAAVVANQVLEHLLDPVGALRSWRDALLPGGRVHVQVPTLEAMYGGAEYFFQVPHVTNWTRRTLTLALLTAGFRVDRLGIEGTVLYATATRSEDAPLSAAALADAIIDGRGVDDVLALIAAHERSRTDMLSAFLSGAPLEPGAEGALREELRLAVAALSMVRESLAQLARDADSRSRAAGETGETTDPWLLGYSAGKSREGQVYSGVLGSLQNSMDVWAMSPRGRESA